MIWILLGLAGFFVGHKLYRKYWLKYIIQLLHQNNINADTFRLKEGTLKYVLINNRILCTILCPYWDWEAFHPSYSIFLFDKDINLSDVPTLMEESVEVFNQRGWWDKIIYEEYRKFKQQKKDEWCQTRDKLKSITDNHWKEVSAQETMDRGVSRMSESEASGSSLSLMGVNDGSRD